MKIDFSQQIKYVDGSVLNKRGQTSDASDPMTLGWCCVESLLATYVDEKATGDEKARRYDLAMKIYSSGGLLDLPVDDVSYIKGLCDKFFSPLIVGQTRRMMEGDNK